MSLKYHYAYLPVSNHDNEPETVESFQSATKELGRRRYPRRQCIICFIGGLLFGVVATCTCILVLQQYRTISRQTPSDIPPIKHGQGISAWN